MTFRALHIGLAAIMGLPLFFNSARASGSKRWFKGNTHTHSFWSDGDEFPEMIADWYKSHHYDFLAFSDHNSIQEGEKWLPINDPNRPAILKNYVARFGDRRVEQRQTNGTNYVRLKRFEEFQPLFAEKNKFLLLRGEELSARADTAPIHIGAVNLEKMIEPYNGTNVTEVIDKNLELIFEQRKKMRQPVFAHVNHPNFQWAMTPDQLMHSKNEKFFEVYNGHPHVHNDGDASRPSTERFWDLQLAHRLTDLKLPVVYGIATDDCHHYQTWGARKNNPGEGWVMVHAGDLTASSLFDAMENGDFYASSGVTLRDVRREKNSYTVEIEPEHGVTYRIQFVGTRAGFENSTVGEVLQETNGTGATYKLKGDEIYVRAKVTSSKLTHADATPTAKTKESVETFQSAWTQPLVNKKVALVSKK
jgi:hypothetical protein